MSLLLFKKKSWKKCAFEILFVDVSQIKRACYGTFVKLFGLVHFSFNYSNIVSYFFKLVDPQEYHRNDDNFLNTMQQCNAMLLILLSSS